MVYTGYFLEKARDRLLKANTAASTFQLPSRSRCWLSGLSVEDIRMSGLGYTSQGYHVIGLGTAAVRWFVAALTGSWITHGRNIWSLTLDQ